MWHIIKSNKATPTSSILILLCILDLLYQVKYYIHII